MRAELASPKPPSRRRRIRRAARRMATRLVSGLGPFVLRHLARTWRITMLGEENLEAAAGGKGGYFIALWHGRMVLGLPHHGQRDWCVLVSASGDGDIPIGLLEGFGYRTIRGSGGRSGPQAVREMLTVLDGGAVMVITPDGPRGPRHSMSPGLAWLARATGYPVVPVGFACDRAWYARSWDRFTIPRPWARVVMTYETPVSVARGAGETGLASASEAIRQGLLRAERRGFDLLQREPDW